MTTLAIRTIQRNVMKGRTTVSLVNKEGKPVGFISLNFDLLDPNVKQVTIQ